MEPERWSQVNELLGRALERPADERAAFLAACEDAAVRREAESLLGLSTDAVSHLERPPLPLLGAAPEIGADRTIGAYRLVRELGRGGMGIVYLAERADGAFDRRVAVKVLKRGLDTAEIVRRFRTERQILANLRHPGIAELYEGGSTEDGRPYFVLELVEGDALLTDCEDRRLGIGERLALFLKVADAVQLAHRNLVVHRDLKPANILVTKDGQPKLLDFGIAKLLGPANGEAILQTALGTRPLTPAYASPEQIRGEPVTTATDVYALGVLLYELLTGRRPYALDPEIDVSTPEALAAVICESEPVRPSVAVTRDSGSSMARSPEAARRLRRRLAGDLDNIVLKAMEKDPRRRYSSVEQLAEDVERHRAGLPVRARRPTLAYRAGKLLRRRGRELAVATVAVAVLGGVLVDREIQQRQTRRALTRAERVSRFLVELFEVADPSEARGRSITAREVLDRGAERIRTELDDEPEVQAALMNTIGTVYHGLGLFDEAEPLLRDAVARRRASGDRRDLRQSLYELAYLLYDQGKLDESEALYREVLGAAAEREPDGSSAGAEPRDPLTPKALNNLGLILHARGDYDGAEALYRRALNLNRALYGELHPDVAVGLGNLGAVLHWQGDDTAAEAMDRESLRIARKLLGPRHPSVAMRLNSLGMLEAARGDLETAEKDLREALAINRSLHGEDHPDIALVLGNLCGVLHAGGRLADAEALCSKALEMSRRLLGEQPRVAAQMITLGSVMIDQGRADEAEPLLRRALAMDRSTLPQGHWRIADAESVLGACLTDLGRYREAEEMLLTSYPVLRSDTPAGSRYGRDARSRLRALYRAWGKPNAAAGFADRAPAP